MIVTCPRCFTFDDVRPRRLPEGGIEYTCTGDHDDGAPYVWSIAAAAVEVPASRTSARSAANRGTRTATPRSSSPRTAAPRGSADDLAAEELLEPLLGCVVAGEPFVEYGIVEYRLRLARPELFEATVRERGHVMLGARRAQASATTRFTKVLARLADAGVLETVKGPGTGAWRLHPSIGYWARPPRPTGPLLTWTMFCAATGRSVEWTDDDRAPFVAPGSAESS